MSNPVLQTKKGDYRVLTMTTPHRYQYRTWWGITWSAWTDISDQCIPLSALNELRQLENSRILHSQDDQYRYVLSFCGNFYTQKRGWYDTWHDVDMKDLPVDVITDFSNRTLDISDKFVETVKFLSGK